MENNTQLTTRQDNMPVSDLQTLSKTFYDSGLFADVKSQQQAMVKILAGQEVGIPPFQSLSGIHIILGKPVIGAGLIASKIKGSGKYDYIVEKMDDKICSIDFYQGANKIGNSTFTAEEAKKALTKNMDKHPKNMLFARAISNGVKWYCPDVFGGPIYVPEEKDFIKAETIDTDYTDEATEHAFEVLNASTSLEELQKNWASLSKEEKKYSEVLSLKETLKQNLTA